MLGVVVSSGASTSTDSISRASHDPIEERVLNPINSEGIVVDQTLTMIGQSFYQNFVVLWREKAHVERYSLAVRERPSARQGS